MSGPPPDITRLRLLVVGRVQGVGYRYFAREAALGLGLVGFVRNEPDGSVSLLAEGARAALEALARACRAGPRHGHVTHVEAFWSEATHQLEGFEIQH